jgi:hypothetical protein
MRRAAFLGACALAVLLAAAPVEAGESTGAQVRATRAVVHNLEEKVQLMELSVARYANWKACIDGVPVSEYGDPDRQFGYLYDERDGTPVGFMPALAVDRESRPRREDYLFLRLRQAAGCRSKATMPGGTADPASLQPRRPQRPSRRARKAAPGGGTLALLERRVARLKRAAARLEAASEDFDRWESCVSWVPVTEYGDPDGGFGFLFGAPRTSVFSTRPALSIDRSDWDDPDYMFLAFVGGNRPGRSCQNEPGEAVD